MAIVGVHRHAVSRCMGGLLVGLVFLTGCLHDEGKTTLVQVVCDDARYETFTTVLVPAFVGEDVVLPGIGENGEDLVIPGKSRGEYIEKIVETHLRYRLTRYWSDGSMTKEYVANGVCPGG